jgi:hypothetical protein
MKLCPSCKLGNPSTALRCDCGYDFVTDTVKRSYLDPQGMDDAGAIIQAGFCNRCIEESSPKSPGGVTTINGIGRMFYGSSRRCNTCDSIVRTLWVVVFFVPIIPLGKYRYQRIRGTVFGGRFLARRLR